MIPILYAVAIAAIVILVTVSTAKQFQPKLIGATALCAIGFIYVGFSLQGNPVNLILLEIGVAMVFYFLALIGYTKNIRLIALGILLHGVWDILHQDAVLIKTTIPTYYPLFCSVVDVILAIFFAVYFRMHRRKNNLYLKDKV